MSTFCPQIELLEGSGDPQGAINVALAGTGSHRRSAALWARYLGLLISLQHTDSLQPLIEEALKAVPERVRVLLMFTPIWLIRA